MGDNTGKEPAPRFLNMLVDAMEADEDERVERELYPEGAKGPLARDAVAEEANRRFGVGRGMRIGILFVLAVLAAAGVGLIATRGGDHGAAPDGPAGVGPVAVEPAPAERPSGGVPGDPGTSGSIGLGGPTTTFAPPELLGTWVKADGSLGFEFRADGTYVMATLDTQVTGRYRAEVAGGVSTIILVDPSDPSGLTALMMLPYRLEDGALWVNPMGVDSKLVAGALPVPGSAGPPVVTLAASTATSRLGRVEAGQPVKVTGASGYVSQTVEVSDVTGDITIDAVNGEVSGRFEADYACSPAYCDQPDEVATAHVVIDVIDTRPSTYQQTTWAYEGNAHVRVVFDATSPYFELVDWEWVDDLDATYTVGLDRNWAVFDLDLRVPEDEVITLQVIGVPTR
jgi:hypothetical protein